MMNFSFEYYWPWKGGLPEVEPAEDGGELYPLLKSGIGWIVWVVKPRRWAIPCSFVLLWFVAISPIYHI